VFTDTVPSDLADLWNAKSAQQKLVIRLCAAVRAADGERLKVCHHHHCRQRALGPFAGVGDACQGLRSMRASVRCAILQTVAEHGQGVQSSRNDVAGSGLICEKDNAVVPALMYQRVQFCMCKLPWGWSRLWL
jgi:hypothetical protein